MRFSKKGIIFVFVYLSLALVLLSSMLLIKEVGDVFWYTIRSFLILFFPYLFLNKKNFDPFDPYLGLALMLYLYSVSTLVYVGEHGETFYKESFTDESLSIYVLACHLGSIGLALGYLLSERVLIWRSSYCYVRHDRIKLLSGMSFILLFLFSPFIYDKFNFLEVSSYADVALSSRLDRMADISLGIKDVFLVILPLTFILSGFVIIIFDESRAVVIRIIALFMVFIYIFTSFLSGFRGELISVLLMLAIYYHYTVSRIKLFKAIGYGVVAYFIVNALSIVRTTSSFSEMLMLLDEEFIENGMAFLSLSNSGELITSTNFLRLILGLESGEIEYGLGGITFNQAVVFIPRVIWPDRSLSASEQFVEIFYPGILSSGGGYGSFFLLEAYWDFGLLGVVVYSSLFSIFARYVYSRLVIGGKKNAISIILYSIFYGAFIIPAVRAGMLGVIKMTLISCLPILAYYHFSKKWTSRL